MKTPQFDKKVEEILKDLKPQDRTCRQCQKNFHIYQEDIDFYKLFRVPPPKLCPECRSQHRLAMMPNILKFYKKECSTHPGEQVISCFHPRSPYRIYDNVYYFNPDAWDGREYGKEYDFSRPFFKQFHELSLRVPHFAIQRYERKVINSEYSVDSTDVKDCYLSATIGWSENIYYTQWCLYSHDCFDCLGIFKCEKCYDLIVGTKCFSSKHLQSCIGCIDSTFLYDCRNCQSCFCSTNLRNKKYYFFNEPFSKEEYQKRLAEINLGDRSVFKKYAKLFEDLRKNAIHRGVLLEHSTNSLGDEIGYSKNCKNCFWMTQSENIRWSSDLIKMKDSMDISVAGPGERCYNTVEVLDSFNIKCSYFVGQSMNLEYCFECFDCQDCFGCVGLKKKQFCIFNRQYQEGEYWQLIDKIKTKMFENGEYGEFIPLAHALYAYNDTAASVIYPLNKEDMKRLRVVVIPDEQGYFYEDSVCGIDLPLDIKEVSGDILEKAVLCEVTNKPFRILKYELDFYQKYNIPLPTKHPQIRLLERLKKRRPFKIFDHNCSNCGQLHKTSYPPEEQKKLKIYCEDCYKSEVI